MSFKKVQADRNTVTRDHNQVDQQTGNIYEALAIIAKRADQVGDDLKMELQEKLEEFATQNENLEEIFENKEQIEVSRFYEALPKPTAVAMQEWLESKVYFRRPESESAGEQ